MQTEAQQREAEAQQLEAAGLTLVQEAAELDSKIKWDEVVLELKKQRRAALSLQIKENWRLTNTINQKVSHAQGKTTVFLAREYRASPRKGQMPDLVTWCRAHGAENLITEKAEGLSAFCKALEEAGLELPPDDLISIHRDTVVRFRKAT